MKRMTQIYRSLFQGASDNTVVQIARNAVVEGVRYLTNMLILWLLVDFVLGEKHLALSTAIASLFSGIVNYCLSAIWVFNKKEKTLVQFLYFTLVGAVGLLINVGITTFCTNVCNIHYLVSNTIAQFVVFFFNFFVRKIFVFKK